MFAIVQDTRLLICILLLGGGVLLAFPGARGPTTLAQAQSPYLHQERTIELRDFGVANLAGLAFSPAEGTLIVLDAGRAGEAPARIIKLTTLEDPISVVHVGTMPIEPPNLAFDIRTGWLLTFDQTAGQIAAFAVPPGGRVERHAADGGDLRRFGVARPQGLAVDSAAGRLFVLDASASRIVGLTLDSEDGQGDGAGSGQTTIDLSGLGKAQLRGLAYDPTGKRLFVFDQARQALYELTAGGLVIATRDLASLQIGDLRGMVLAPSGDPTDDPTALNLYIAAGGNPAGQESGMAPGRIVEVALAAPAPAAVPASSSASLVRVIDTSVWSPPSTDPSGITYLPSSGRLLISDGEVDELPQYFTGDNLFETTRSGILVETYSTISFSNEPTDVTINLDNGHLFFSHDGKRLVYEVDLGPDGRYGTSDDKLTSFSTRAFNCVDPEGLAFGDGKLFIADGLGKEIFIVNPGPNGRFDGVAPAGDDQVSHFDTASIGQPDPEGVGFNADMGTLFIISNDHQTTVAETTTSGELLRVIDISFLRAHSPAGVAYSPGSLNVSSKSLYIVDRGVDNGDDPDENDGKVFEIALDGDPLSRTPTPTMPHPPTPSATPTMPHPPTPSATRTPTPTATRPPQWWRNIYLPLIRR